MVVEEQFADCGRCLQHPTTTSTCEAVRETVRNASGVIIDIVRAAIYMATLFEFLLINMLTAMLLYLLSVRAAT